MPELMPDRMPARFDPFLNPTKIQTYPLIIDLSNPSISMVSCSPGADDLDTGGTDTVAPAARAAECPGERGRCAGGALVALGVSP